MPRPGLLHIRMQLRVIPNGRMHVAIDHLGCSGRTPREGAQRLTGGDWRGTCSHNRHFIFANPSLRIGSIAAFAFVTASLTDDSPVHTGPISLLYAATRSSYSGTYGSVRA